MKHLKIFETYTPKLKKYAIEYSGGNTYYIMEILNETEYGTNLRALYYTTTSMNVIKSKESQKTYIYTAEEIKNNIIYTADTIAECEEMLTILINTNKYNL